MHAQAIEGRRAVSLRSMLPLVAEGATTAWVHAARYGSFAGHPAGEFVFDRAAFERIVANFEALQNKAVPLTYDHPHYTGERPVELAGWVHDLRIDDRGLWAHCELTDDAVRLVRRGSYRFASVVVAFDSVHRETGDEIGPELLELALTSSPFIDGLTPLRLTREVPRPKPPKPESSITVSAQRWTNLRK